MAKIQGWKKIHERFYENEINGASIAILPTGKSGTLTKNYSFHKGWVIEVYPGTGSRYEYQRVLFDTKSQAEKEAMRFMKAHPRG
jgi:hypothetical protein